VGGGGGGKACPGVGGGHQEVRGGGDAHVPGWVGVGVAPGEVCLPSQ